MLAVGAVGIGFSASLVLLLVALLIIPVAPAVIGACRVGRDMKSGQEGFARGGMSGGLISGGIFAAVTLIIGLTDSRGELLGPAVFVATLFPFLGIYLGYFVGVLVGLSMKWAKSTSH
jgi:hypothetical protein